jgi:hypothetical protein
MQIHTLRRAVMAGLLAAVTTLISACGGGGTTETLYVDLSYPAGAMEGETRIPMSASANFVGLNGHVPHCSVSAGNLPPGLGLADNCTISGTPSDAGIYAFTVRVTADGVAGSLDFKQGVSISDPTPRLNLGSYIVGLDVSGSDIQVQFPINTQMSAVTLVSQSRGIAVGDSLSYAITGGALPAGTSFDSTNASLSGTATTPGFSSVTITATLTHRGLVYVSTPLTVGIYVTPPVATIGFSGCPYVSIRAADIKWMTAFQCDMTVSNLEPGSSWVVTNASVPAGLSFDPVAARLTGQFLNTDLQYFSAKVVVTLADGRTYTLTPNADWSSNAPQAAWNDASGTFTNMTGVLRGGSQEPFVGGITGMIWVKAGQSITIDPVTIPDALPGDTVSYALAAAPNDVLPPWPSIDSASGRISGVPPQLQGTYNDVLVRLTTTRQGVQGTSVFTWRVVFE